MKLVSTGGEGPATDLRTALTRGLAPDGGLYLPERIDPIDPSVLAEVRGQSFSVVSRAVAGHLLGSIIPADDLDRIVDAALDFEVELVPLGDEVSMNGHGATSGAASGPSGGSLHDLYVLELFTAPPWRSRTSARVSWRSSCATSATR